MRRERIRRNRLLAVGCFALSMLAILLWGRLKLVAAVPRTAYADPKDAPVKGPAGPTIAPPAAGR